MDITIIEMLWNPLSGITSALGDFFESLVEKLLSILTFIPSALLYYLQIGFFYIIDFVQTIFRKMAGLDTYYVDGSEQSGDMVMSMLTNQVIVDIFIAVLVVSIMLLFVTTFVAIIRVEFTEKGAGNAKGPIIGRAIKSIAYFAVVPITCLFGIWISNVFLRSFDQVTSGNSYSLSTTVFFAAAQDGNRARNNERIANEMKENENLLRALGLNSSCTQEDLAMAIDKAYLTRKRVADTSVPGDSVELDTDANAFSYYFCASLLFHHDLEIYTFDTTEFWGTLYFYDLFLGYNYLIGFVGGYMVAQLLLTSVLGLIQRIYELSILFVISPAAVAFMPLDDGKKYQQWRGEFVKRVGMMYGPIIGINLMFQILAVLQHITLFPTSGFVNRLFNALMQLLFIIVGLLSVKDFSGIISNLAGSSDAISVGDNKKKDTKELGQKMMAGQFAAARVGKEVTKATYHSARGHEDRKKARTLDKEAKDLEKQAELTTDKTRAADLRKKASEKRSEANEIREKNEHIKNGLGTQLNAALHGDAVKTGIGGAFGDLAKAGGPALQYFTRSAIAERQKNGQSVIGQQRLFLTNEQTIDENGNKVYKDGATLGASLKNIGRGKGMHVDAAQKANSEYKEKKDHQEQQQWGNEKDAQMAEANARKDYGQYIANNMGLDLKHQDSWSDADKNAFNTELTEMLEKYRGHADGSTYYASIGEIEAQNAEIDTATSTASTAASSAATSSAVTGAYDGGPGGGSPGSGGSGSGSGGSGSGGSDDKDDDDKDEDGKGGGFKVRVIGGKLDSVGSVDDAQISRGKIEAKLEGTSSVNVANTPQVSIKGTANVNVQSGMGPLETAMKNVIVAIAASASGVKGKGIIGVTGLGSFYSEKWTGGKR